jgi:hypothetical protein
MNTESLALKWGTLKRWKLNEGSPAYQAIERYFDAGPSSMSAMLQKDSEKQKEAICEIIDLIDTDQIYLDWDGIYVSKQDAKKYVMEYNND